MPFKYMTYFKDFKSNFPLIICVWHTCEIIQGALGSINEAYHFPLKNYNLLFNFLSQRFIENANVLTVHGFKGPHVFLKYSFGCFLLLIFFSPRIILYTINTLLLQFLAPHLKNSAHPLSSNKDYCKTISGF